MKISEIKKQMIEFRDLYGNELLDVACVEDAQTKEDLSQICESHKEHLETMWCDADDHLERFMKKVGLLK